MSEMLYSSQLFIFDSIVQISFLIVSIILFIKTRALFKLSLQKGIKYFNTAMFFFIFSFSFKYIIVSMDFLTDGIVGTFEATLIGLILTTLNIYAAFIGGFYLGYSLVWRKFEKDRVKKQDFRRIKIVNLAAFILIFTDMYLIINHNFNTPYFFFLSIISFILYAIMVNCKICKCQGRGSKDVNPFLSLVGLGLGVYLMFFIESLLSPYLFTFHYYTNLLAMVFSLTFLYNFMRLTK